jgi:predicted 2-oxoglutarate/Fe(II)-dependent dioxygenase YbiX
MKNINDYIVVFENILTPNLCDGLLQEYANSNEWKDTNTRGGVRKDIRSATSILMSTDQIISVNESVRKKLDQYVYASAGLAINKYNEKFNEAHIEEDSGYELLRYETGQFYTQHTDSFKQAPRAVSCSFGLNDDYEGGEFAFFNREIKIKVPKGAAVMFPSNFMYPHEILPVTKGIRYSIVTWFI